MGKYIWTAVGSIGTIILSIPTLLIVLALIGPGVGGVLMALVLAVLVGAAGAFIASELYDWIALRKADKAGRFYP